MFSRYLSLVVGSVCCAGWGIGCGEETPKPVVADVVAPPAPKGPNVLLVTLDTTRWDALTPYGGIEGLTPNLSRLANEGMRFDHAYTVTPLTIPAHSSLHTGLLPPQHGVRDNGDLFLSASLDTLAERFSAAGYATAASVGAEVTSAHWGFGQGFEAYFDDMGEAATSEANRWRVERPGNQVVDDALGWMAEGPKSRPWFVWVHMFDAHHPYEPVMPELAPDRPYMAEVGFLDIQVGRLVKELEAKGELDNTWIVVLSDHGEGLGNHGEMAHGMLLYNDTVKIPLIVRPPKGLAQPVVFDFPVTIADVAPSLLGVAGLPKFDPVDGTDLSPWLLQPDRDTAPLMDRSVYLESLYGWHHYQWSPLRAIVSKEHKFIDGTQAEMYARADVSESTNIAPEQAALLASYQQTIDRRASEFNLVVDGSSAVSLDSDTIARLEALGYVTGGTPSSEQVPFRGTLPDAITRMPVLRKIEAMRMAIQSENWKEAREVGEAILKEEPAMEQVSAQLAMVLGRMGDMDAAFALIVKQDQIRPTSMTRLGLGNMYLGRGQKAEAIAAFQDSIARDPHHRGSWISYLRALVILQELPLLDTEIARAETYFPGDAFVSGYRGMAKFVSGDWAGAMPLLKAAVSEDARLPLIHHALGLMHMRAQNAEEAKAEFLLELVADPNSIPAKHGLVGAYGVLGMWQEQLDMVKAVVGRVPPDPRMDHARGFALLRLGRTEEALDAVGPCFLITPVFPECYMVASEAYSILGQLEKAGEYYQLAQDAKRTWVPPAPNSMGGARRPTP